VTCLIAVVVVLAGTGWGLARVRIDTTASAFLPAGDPALTTLDDTARAFGGDPIVILAQSATPRSLTTGDQLGALIGLEGRLAKLPDVAVVYGPGTLLNQVAQSAHNLMTTIFGRQDAIRAQAQAAKQAAGASPDEVKAAGADAVAAFNARYGALLLQALPAGLPTVHNQGFVDAVAYDPAGAPRSEWHFLLPSAHSVVILVRPREGLDQDGTARLVDAARNLVEHSGLTTSQVTITGTPTVFADLGRTVQREIPLLGGVALALIILCYLGVKWVRRPRHRLIPLAATLGATLITLAIFGWSGTPLSIGAVAFLPILIGIGSDFPAYIVHAVPARRLLVAAGASAAGFAALGLSPLPFVRDLGLALALGVAIAVALAFAIRRWLVIDDGDSAPIGEPGGEPPARPPGRYRAAVLVALLGVAAAGWVMLPRLQLSAQPEQLAAGLPAVAAAQHAEAVIGSSGELDIRLRGPNVRTVPVLDWLRRTEDVVVREYGGRLRPVVSLPTLLAFLGPHPAQEQLIAALDLLPDYLTGAVLSNDNTQAVTSLGVSLQELQQQDKLIKDLRAALPPAPPGTTVDVVGLPVAAARGYELISGNRYLANLAGIVAAGLVLLIGLRRRGEAMRAVLAAAMATGWGLAGAWLLGVELSPLSVALGSLTTATAGEFTVLLGHARLTRHQVLRRTVLVAAGAATLGYLALTLSGLEMLREFGFLLAASVVLSLAAATSVVQLLPDRPPSESADAGEPQPLTPAPGRA
jgi:predicted RND superfamily exporter protein